MTPRDLETLRGWAAAEGWNPGISDLEVAFSLDPAAFLGIRRGPELIGSLCTFRHTLGFGFMGLFFISEELRGAGMGGDLGRAGLDLMRQRLAPAGVIGIDGVFEMAPWYASNGFVLSHRDLRFEGNCTGVHSTAVTAVTAENLGAVLHFDAEHFETDRTGFLPSWLAAPGVHSGVLMDGDAVTGFGVLRPCERGHKIGPLFARRRQDASEILLHLVHQAGDTFVQLDVPEVNAAGVQMAEDLGLIEAFGCARMYFGGTPTIDWSEVYGVTSFEFG